MSNCVNGCKYKGEVTVLTVEQLEQFPNLAAKQAISAWRCKNPKLTTADGLEFYETTKGVCYCGSAMAQVPLTDCRGFEK